jgi:catalase
VRDAVGPVLGSYPGNRVTHTKGVNLTGTFTATPRARELTRAAHMQGEGAEATEAFLADNPDIAEAAGKIAAAGDPPRSWATMAFNSLNAYRLVNAAGEGQFVRWRLAPEAGEHSLPVEERATADNDYLMTGVLGELPVRYRLLAQLAHADDQTTDASKA